MTLLLSALYALVLVCLGEAILRLVRAPGAGGRLSRGAMSLAVGAGALPILLFWVSLLGLRPTRPVTLGCVAVVGLFGLFREDRRLVRPTHERFDAFVLLCALPALGFVAFVSIGVPLYEWDALAIWGLKAKVVYFEPVRQAAYFHDASKIYSHPDYPLGLPFLTAGLYGLLGGVDEIWGKAMLPCLFFAFVFVLYQGLRECVDRRVALVLACATAYLPTVIRWAGAGTADAVLTLYIAGSLYYWMRWFRRPESSEWLLAAFFSAFGLFTKTEGLATALAIGLAAALAAPRGRRRVAIYYGGVVALISTPWVLFQQTLPPSFEQYASHLTAQDILAHLDRVGPIVSAFAMESIRFSQWGGFWMLPVIGLVIGFGALRTSAARFLWIAWALHLSAYFTAYLVTPHPLEGLLNATLSRLCLHLVPAGALLAAVHFNDFLARLPNRNES